MISKYQERKILFQIEFQLSYFLDLSSEAEGWQQKGGGLRTCLERGFKKSKILKVSTEIESYFGLTCKKYKYILQFLIITFFV